MHDLAEIVNALQRLEGQARKLEPGPSERRQLFREVEAYAESFLNELEHSKAYTLSDEKGAGLYASPIGETPVDLQTALALYRKHVDGPGINPASGGHLGYIPGGGLVHSAFGDLLADITNRYSGIFFANPGAVRMENMLIKWMAEITGYPRHAAGNLTSGGSIANLIAIVSAREAFKIKGKDLSKTVIYLSGQVHHCIKKAIRIAGLQECVVHSIPLDKRYRMRADLLDGQIREDKRRGLRPWLLVASAGTTDTGAIDPLGELAEVAHKHELWYHIDGAYGAFFVLCDEGREKLQGMELSDSLVMDPHKSLFLPYGSGAVLVRNPDALLESHYYMPNYLQDAKEQQDEISPADLSPELTKHFRGPRLWLPLKLLGVAPFRAALEEKLWLARYFYEKIQTIDGFEVGPYPDLSVVTYRYIPRRGDADAFNRRLVKEIHRDGRVFVSSTILDGRFTLRLAVLVFRTHRDTIDLTVDILKEKAVELESQT